MTYLICFSIIKELSSKSEFLSVLCVLQDVTRVYFSLSVNMCLYA